MLVELPETKPLLMTSLTKDAYNAGIMHANLREKTNAPVAMLHIFISSENDLQMDIESQNERTKYDELPYFVLSFCFPIVRMIESLKVTELEQTSGFNK